MKQQTNTERFEVIVRTLLSSQPIDTNVLQAHVREYAQANGLPYNLAVQAITLVVKDRISRKLAQLGDA